jgi:hypothetical protein
MQPVLASGAIPMTADTATLNNKEAITVLREIDLNDSYRLTADNREGLCVIEGVCFERDTGFFLTVSTDLDIIRETIAILALRNIKLQGVIAPTEDDSHKIILAQSLYRNIRPRAAKRIQHPALIVRFGDDNNSPLKINDISEDGIGITVSVDDYIKYSSAGVCRFMLDRDTITVNCRLINSQQSPDGLVRLGYTLDGDKNALQRMITKYATNLH